MDEKLIKPATVGLHLGRFTANEVHKIEYENAGSLFPKVGRRLNLGALEH
jgi:hypothetical protein